MLAIFLWRILAKSLLHRALPPAYRFLAQLMTLPHRRFYTPATDYTSMPFSPDQRGLRAIPSVLNLPGVVALEVDDVNVTTTARDADMLRELKMRFARSKAGGEKVTIIPVDMDQDQELGGKTTGVVKHYDATGEFFDTAQTYY